MTMNTEVTNEQGQAAREEAGRGRVVMLCSTALSLLLASLPAQEQAVLSVHGSLNEKPPLSPLQHGPDSFSVTRETMWC